MVGLLITRRGRHFVAQQNRKTRFSGENVVSFVRTAEPVRGSSTALDLVYQAAELFEDMEARARETEARAHSLCTDAAERLRVAEARSQAAERSRREVITEAECKLQDASRALKQAALKLTAAEDRVTAAEVRACVAEARARETADALALVEEAIRRRLLTVAT
jgi:hypothetical protein